MIASGVWEGRKFPLEEVAIGIFKSIDITVQAGALRDVPFDSSGIVHEDWFVPNVIRSQVLNREIVDSSGCAVRPHRLHRRPFSVRFLQLIAPPQIFGRYPSVPASHEEGMFISGGDLWNLLRQTLFEDSFRP